MSAGLKCLPLLSLGASADSLDLSLAGGVRPAVAHVQDQDTLSLGDLSCLQLSSNCPWPAAYSLLTGWPAACSRLTGCSRSSADLPTEACKA